MKPPELLVQQPATLQEALELLAAEPDSKILAGGQSLLPLLNFRLSRPTHVIDINGLGELGRIERTEGRLRLGALVRHQQLVRDAVIRECCPILAIAASHIGHWAIRNRGTLGGSLAHADPAAELPAAMVALEANIWVRSRQGERVVAAPDFFRGYFTTDLAPGEMVTAVDIALQGRLDLGFAEIARRRGDFALAGAYVRTLPDARAVTWFGVGSLPVTATLPLSALPGDEESWAHVLDSLDIVEPDADWRRHLAKVVAQRAMGHAIQKGGQDG